MCEGGVREKTLLEEIETLDIEDHIKERIKRKYWNENGCRAYRRKLVSEIRENNVL